MNSFLKQLHFEKYHELVLNIEAGVLFYFFLNCFSLFLFYLNISVATVAMEAKVKNVNGVLPLRTPFRFVLPQTGGQMAIWLS